MKKLLPLLLVPIAIGSMYVAGFAQIEVSDKAIINPDKWEIRPNKLKTTTGRLLLNNPAGSIWVIYVYRMADNKYITSYNQSNNKGILILPPGEYKITLNLAPVENVLIKKGHDTKLKTGVIDIPHNEVWYLYDETGKTYHSSGIKPGKLLMPTGNYTMKVGGQASIVKVENSNEENGEPGIIDAPQYTMAPMSENVNDPKDTTGLLWLIPNQQTFTQQLNFTITVSKKTGEQVFYCDYSLPGSIHCWENTVLPEGDYDIFIGANTSDLNYVYLNPCFSPHYNLVLYNIPVRRRYETKLKYGYLQHSSSQQGLFQIFNASGETSHHLYIQHGSGLPYPVGRYVVKHYFVGDFPVEITDGKTTYFNSIDSAYLEAPKWTTRMLSESEDPLIKNQGRLNTFFPNPFNLNSPNNNFVFLRIPNPNSATGYTSINLDTIKYIDLKPGRYKFSLNNVITDVLIEAGREKTLRYGNLQIKFKTQFSWQLRSASGLNGYRTGWEEITMALPIGYYKLEVRGKIFLIKIQESSTLLFNYTCLFND